MEKLKLPCKRVWGDLFTFSPPGILNILLLSLIFSPLLSFAQSDGLPRGAFQMPYVRYESEAGSRGGGANYYQNPTFLQDQIAAEASDQKYVGLPNNGAYVEWTVNQNANGVTMRFTMPDAPGGEGNNGSLDVYVNGSLSQTVNLTSYWAWQYFPGSEPEDHPGNRPRMRFDEVHFLLNNPLSPGDVLRIQKNNGDGFEYGVDFVEIENVAAPRQKPSGYVSVTDYGATPNDGTDDLAAFQSALTAAQNAGTGVYIPQGRFMLSQKLIVNENNIGVTGAGMWHTELYFSTEAVFSGGILARCSNVEFSHFYLNTVNNQRFLNGQYVTYKGFMGTYGNNSSIHDVWVTHFECGAWIAGYDPPYPIDITQNLNFSNNRIRNNYADGINLCQGTSNTIVAQNNFRSNGDDAMAVWPNSDFGAPMAVNNIFRYNTVEHTYRAGGAAIFGGDGHEVHHCIIKDNMAGSGIRLTTDFPGYHFDNTNQIRFYENTIIACGTSNDLWNFHRGAIEVNSTGGAVRGVYFENINVIDAQRHGIQIGGNGSDLHFDNISVNGTGLDPYTASLYTVASEGAAILTFGGSGTAVFNNLSMENIERDPPIFQANQNFNLILQNINVPLTGISLSENNLNLAAGQSASLSVIYSPTNATNKAVSWSSSNASVATYDEVESKVVAHGTGTATLTVTSADGGHTAQITVTVVSAVNIVANDDQADENGDTGQFTISISETSQNVTVNYSVSGTASPSDYSANPSLSGSITLTPSNTSRIIIITPLDDSDFEDTETLTLTLQSGSGYQLGGSTSASISITDNDNAPCSAPNIGLTSTPPTIDQNVDAVWNNVGAVNISNVTLGGMPGDFSGSYKALYDNNNLYLLVQSTDNSLNNDSGGEWWNDDVMNIFIDGDNSKGSSYDGQNDFQLGFRWNDGTVHLGGNSVQNASGINHSMYSTGNGYAMEVSIPWSTIGVTPAIGNQIGIDVQIDDDDGGGARDAQIAAFSTSEMAWSNPSLFGTVYLTTCGDVVVANAGTDQSLPKGTTSANLSGAGSSGPGTLSYAWTQVNGPSVSIANANAVNTTVSGLSDGNSYTFQLAVSSNGTTATDVVAISIGSNQPPVVNAGNNLSIQLPTNSATLSGSATDSDGTISSYAWTQVSGPSNASLTGQNTAVLNASNLVEGSYVFRLTATDNNNASASDEVLLTVSSEPVYPTDRGDYDAPYTRYESENATLGNGASVQGPTYDMAQLASEASDRKFVSLPSNGSYVEWTVSSSGLNGLNLRFSLSDNSTGTMGVYVNGSKVRDISLSSYWAWQYFDISPSTTGTPSNTPQGSNPEPRMRFDEVHVVLANALNSGDVIRLQKDGGGGAYGIDFIELENVPAPISQPAGYLNIMDYGATPNDETNDAAAFRTCLDLANGDPSIQGIYIPAGRFINGQGNGSPSGNMWVPNDGLTIQGAGMWHTEIYFSSTSQNGAGFLFDANNIHLQDFYMNSATNSRIPGNKAVNGSVGSGSTITNVWAEHFETGFWISSMQSGGWNVTDGLVISNCRIRNVYADGVNLAKGTRNTVVEHTSFRNCIDDAMATWSVNYLEAVPPTPSYGNIFRYNTVENNLRAAGLGFFGGHSHEAHHLIIKDNFAGPGIRLNTQFPAYPFGSNASEAINIHDVTVIGCGTTKNIWTYRFGAIELELPEPTQGQAYDLQYANFTNIDVINSQHDAVFVHSYMPSNNDRVIDNIFFNNVHIDGTGVALDVNNGPQYTTGSGESGGHGIYVANFSPTNTFDGWMELSNTTFTNIAGEDIAFFNNNGDFEVRIDGNPSNQAPTANAGSDQSLSSGTTTANLSGSGTDPDGDNVSFSWSQISGPAATLNNAQAANASASGLSNGNTYVFSLTVSDGVLSSSDDVSITVQQGNTNQAPTANAGNDQNLPAGTGSANLSGSGTDPDGNSLTYSWSQINGPSVSISNANAASTSVNGLASGNSYVFRLTVSDGSLSSTDDVTITVTPDNTGSTAYRIKNRWQNTYLRDGGDRVQYTNSSSGDSYLWVLEDVNNGQEIRNVATGHYMHIENLTGQVQCTPRTFGWQSSRWAMEDAGGGFVRIRNVWQGNQYINVENLQGNAQHGTIYPQWESAQWVLEPVSISARVGSSDSMLSEAFNVYPNPAENEFTIAVDSDIRDDASFVIYNLSGTSVKEGALTGSHTQVDTDNMTAGIYLLKVISGDSIMHSKISIK
ncbi:PKD domain-containing protein [Fulvivirga ligni]|uniref:PKD domain-containing protein n=1 Tax=Fulvivirga ligni TaxID=2904246 RepID=UPI001F34DAE3|nr:sugar-binding protein [Fulvivirga ligni]UII24169.1 Ig-like domain-containing protein [Fulvivirga ligni]